MYKFVNGGRHAHCVSSNIRNNTIPQHCISASLFIECREFVRVFCLYRKLRHSSSSTFILFFVVRPANITTYDDRCLANSTLLL